MRGNTLLWSWTSLKQSKTHISNQHSYVKPDSLVTACVVQPVIIHGIQKHLSLVKVRNNIVFDRESALYEPAETFMVWVEIDTALIDLPAIV